MITNIDIHNTLSYWKYKQSMKFYEDYKDLLHIKLFEYIKSKDFDLLSYNPLAYRIAELYPDKILFGYRIPYHVLDNTVLSTYNTKRKIRDSFICVESFSSLWEIYTCDITPDFVKNYSHPFFSDTFALYFCSWLLDEYIQRNIRIIDHYLMDKVDKK